MPSRRAAAAPLDVAAVQAALRGRRPRRLAALRLSRPEPDRRRRHRRRPAGRPPGDAALVLPDSRHRRAARPGPRDRARLARAPARHDRRVRRPRAARGRPAARCSPACGASRWNIRPAARFRTSSRVDAGTIELVRQAGVEVVSSGDLDPAVLRRLGRRRDRDAPSRRPRSCTASRIARSRRSRAACATASPTTEYDIQQLMAGWFRDEGLVSDSRPERVGRGERRQPALPADGGRASRDSARRARAARPLGQARSARRGVMPTSPGWATPGRACPSGIARAFAAVRAARDAGDRAGAGRGRARAARCAAGEVDRAASAVLRERRLRRQHPAPDRPQPRRIRARQRREHGRLRDPRRPAAAAGHRLHDRAGRLLRRLRRPVGNQHDRRRARRGGDRAAADRDSWHSCSQERFGTMSTRKTTLFYVAARSPSRRWPSAW